MNCREKILSEDYMSILLDYVPEEADQEDEAFCYQQVDGTLGIYYLDRSAVCRFLRSITCIATFHSCFASVRFQRREVGRFGQNRWRAPGFWHSSGPRWS